MLRIPRFVSTCCALFILPLTSVAAELTDAIPMDLARILFDREGNEQFAIYTHIPDDFPPFEMPAGFTLIASMRNGISKIVALDTNLSKENSEQLFVDAFEAEGWINIPMSRISSDIGFVAGDDTASPRISLCHDQFGRLGFSYAIHNGRPVFSYSSFINIGFNDRRCAELLTQRSQLRSNLNLNTGINPYMPRLVVPDGSMPGGFVPMLNLQPYNRETEAQSNITLNLDWGIQAAFDHFATQLLSQDWLQDSSSIGAVSASGIWTKQTPDGMDLVGTLTAANAREGKIDLRFHIKGNRQ